jgi:hypothetical protein
MYKIAVMGDKDSVLGFKALGLEVCPVESPDQGREALHRMAKENYAIIYMTEQLAAQMPDEVARYKDPPSSSSPARRAPWASAWPMSRPPWNGRSERIYCNSQFVPNRSPAKRA